MDIGPVWILLMVLASVQLVDMFCYLGDMLSVDGHAAAAVEARVSVRD